jgi:ERCC4-type nuclease
MNQMEFIVDSRENALKKIIENRDPKPNFTVKQMDIGDFEFKYNDKTVLLIERKTYGDLLASVKTGRYREQKYRIRHSEIPNYCVLYLIEGNINSIEHLLGKPGKGGMTKKSIKSLFSNLLVRDNMKLYMTDSKEDSVDFLMGIYDKISKDGKKYLDPYLNTNGEQNLNYLSTIKLTKKENLSYDNCFKLQLMQVRGVSNGMATIIAEKYPNMYALCKAYDSKAPQDSEQKRKRRKKKTSEDLYPDIYLNLLADFEIEVANDKKRKIGNVISHRIYCNLFNCDLEAETIEKEAKQLMKAEKEAKEAGKAKKGEKKLAKKEPVKKK